MSAIGTYKEVNHFMLAQLDEREQEVSARERAARAEFETCALDRKAIEADRAVLLKAEALYDKMQGLSVAVPEPPPPPPPPPTLSSADAEGTEGQSRARIGPQRYLILNAIRGNPNISLEEIVRLTLLSTKRVRDQLSTDVPTNIKSETGLFGTPENPAYSLTKMGEHLMLRFEDYRRVKGEPLPTVESVHASGPTLDDLEQERRNLKVNEIKAGLQPDSDEWMAPLMNVNTETAEKDSEQEPSATSVEAGNIME